MRQGKEMPVANPRHFNKHPQHATGLTAGNSFCFSKVVVKK